METDFLPGTVIRAADGCVFSSLDDGAVILHLASGQYFGLNEVGARIWALLARPRSIEDIQDEILVEYDVDIDRCAREVRTLLSDLKQANLIEVKHGVA